MVKYPGGALLPTLSFDRETKTPIGTQLGFALREMILSGKLQPGERLPSSRILAKDQGVSRTTVINVYEQLTAEGLIQSQVGAGAYVVDTLQITPSPAIIADGQPRQPPRLAQLSSEASEQYFPRLTHPEEPCAFMTGIPAFDQFPMAIWSSLNVKYWRQPRNHVLSYPPAEGVMELRKAIAMHLRANRGIICKPEEVFIFNGAQDAFNRIGNTLLDPGDIVWFENPGAIGARNSLVSSGAQLIPLPIDQEGIDVAEGLRLAPDFRLAFVTPAHQHPLGVTMSLHRRMELLRAAERVGAWIVEDDYVGEFHYSGHPPPTLKSVDTSGRVIYVGSFSKSLFAALRLGYIVAPPELAPIFQRIAGATMQGAPTSLQSVVANFIEGGHFSSHIRRMRMIYSERLKALQDGTAKHLDGLMTIEPRETGFQTIGHLAPDFDEEEVARRAAERGIYVSPVSRFTIVPVRQKGLILGFSAVPPNAITSAVKKLEVLFREMRSEKSAKQQKVSA